MRQLTVRGFDDELSSAIQGLAQREGISLNKAALRLLRKGAGLADGSEGRQEDWFFAGPPDRDLDPGASRRVRRRTSGVREDRRGNVEVRLLLDSNALLPACAS